MVSLSSDARKAFMETYGVGKSLAEAPVQLNRGLYDLYSSKIKRAGASGMEAARIKAIQSFAQAGKSGDAGLIGKILKQTQQQAGIATSSALRDMSMGMMERNADLRLKSMMGGGELMYKGGTGTMEDEALGTELDLARQQTEINRKNAKWSNIANMISAVGSLFTGGASLKKAFS